MNKLKSSVRIHGHRGSRGTHPENTVPAFEEARDAGAHFIELDVHLSREGEVVVFHDFEIGGKLLSDLSLQEIRVHEPAPGHKIPTLEEVLKWKLSRAPSLALNVEIKRDTRIPSQVPSAERLAESVLSLLKRYDLISGTLVQSFDFEVVRAARGKESGLSLSCLFEEKAEFARIAHENGAQVAAPHFPLIAAQDVECAQRLGIDVLPWTVNRAEDWARLIGLGITSMITDYPRELSRFVE